MNIRELIDELEAIASDHGDETEVRLAHQPAWPFEHDIGNVVACDLGEAPTREMFEDDDAGTEAFLQAMREHDAQPHGVVAYIGEARQIGYLPGAVANELGWGGR